MHSSRFLDDKKIERKNYKPPMKKRVFAACSVTSQNNLGNHSSIADFILGSGKTDKLNWLRLS